MSARGRVASERARAVSALSRLALAGVLALALAVMPLCAHAAVTASLDNNQVAPGDSVQLTLERAGQTSSAPDLSPLERDFDILGSSRATTVEILNGNTSAKTQVTITLSPKRAGRLIVPSVVWDGEKSPALALAVTASAGSGGSGANTGASGGSAGSAGAGGDSSGRSGGQQVFLQSEFSPAQPYVQAAVDVTLRLYTREALYNPSIDFSGPHDVVVRQIGSDETGSVMRGGKSYEVVTRHYVLFPQRSGRMSFSGPVLNAQVAVGNPADAALNDPFAGLFGPTPFAGNVISSVKPIRLHGAPITLDVRPRPAGVVGSYWMPASEVTLTDAWHPTSLQAHAGDPVTVDLDLQAVGLTAAQLPDLSQLLQLPAGVKTYPDEAKLSDSARGASVVGTRTQSIALIADQAGRFTIPALRVQWWDTRANQARETIVPAHTLVVVPAAGSSPSPLPGESSVPAATTATATAAAASASSGRPAAFEARQSREWFGGRSAPWLGLCSALVLAWLATLGAWLRLRKRVARGGAAVSDRMDAPAPAAAPIAAGATTARAAFRLACRRNDAAGARRHLLAWVRAAWPDVPPSGLNALAKQLDDPSAAALVRELDRACYVGEPWDGEALGVALARLPSPRSETADSSSDLAGLYP